MSKGKNVLTTGEVAKICNVAPRTVSKWFDNGQLRGYRIPGSKDRRIPVSELICFMKENNIPSNDLPGGKTRVLIIETNVDAAFVELLGNHCDCEVQTAQSNCQAGLMAQKFEPHVLFVNLMDQDLDVKDICRSVRSCRQLQSTKIIAIANPSSEPEARALLQKGFDSYISYPVNADEVISQLN
ncbi:MAG: helix-turn-helix domain-containing protein [Sedimentisphaerales bacterium]|nr:helix-turn-helix domain-containing protein [Sedimentisphaerales bacterium]